MTPGLQAQDVINAVIAQREAANNECAKLIAQLAAAQRRIAELEPKTGEKPAADPLPSVANGHDEARPAA